MFESLRIKVDPKLPEAIYYQIAESLEKWIRDAEIPPDSKLPGMKALSEMAGVSGMTVERALKKLIDDGVCYRRPKRGTFVGDWDNSMRKLRRVCGILHCDDELEELGILESDQVAGPVYRGIKKEAFENGMEVIFLSEESLPFYLNNSEFEFNRVVMLGYRKLEPAASLARNFPGVPFVFVNYRPKNFETMPKNVYGVFSDDFAGGFEAGEELLRRGHRDLAVITVSITDSNYDRRVDGIRNALLVNGTSWKDDFLHTDEALFDPSIKDQLGMAHGLTEIILRERPEVSAIFCVNDIIASGVVDQLRLMGVQRVEVVGYDNAYPFLSIDRGFSTLRIDYERIGRRSIEVLTKRDIKYPKELRLPPVFLKRFCSDSYICESEEEGGTKTLSAG